MKISLNSILILLVSMVLVFFFSAGKSGTFLSGSEAQVYLLLMVTLASLFVNSYVENEFLEILTVVFVGFYICRIPFIFGDNLASDVISRNVDVSHIPWYISVLTIQYLSLAFCILVVNPRVPRVSLVVIPEFIFRRILFFSFLIILINTISIFLWFNIHGGTSSHVLAILKTIFTPDNALILIFIASLMIEKNALQKYKYIIISCALLFIFSYVYRGSKAGLLQVILLAYLAIVTIRGPMIFRWGSLFVAGLLGIGAFLLIFVGKVYRIFQITQENVSLDQFIFYFHRFFVEQSSISDLLNMVSERVGYLDFFIQKISNPVYEPYVSFSYYFKALVDKMTPGFDVFEVPFASRAIYSAYHGSSVGVLNSELISVFTESHLLLGFFSFVMYLGVLFFIKRVLSGFKASSGVACGLFYMYIISSFYWWLTGSGLDMTIALIIYQGIFVFFAIWLIQFWLRKLPI